MDNLLNMESLDVLTQKSEQMSLKRDALEEGMKGQQQRMAVLLGETGKVRQE